MNKYNVTIYSYDEIEKCMNKLFENGYHDIAYCIQVYHQFSLRMNFFEENGYAIDCNDSHLSITDFFDWNYIDACYMIPLGFIIGLCNYDIDISEHLPEIQRLITQRLERLT